MHHVATLRRAVICALVVPAIALTACGDENIPGNAVAKVDGTLIKKADFDHWMQIAVTSSQSQLGGSKKASTPPVPDPPEYRACIAHKRTTAPKPKKGEPRPKDSDYKQQCQQEYEAMRDQVMQLLIQDVWIRGEAEEQGIELTDEQLRKEFEKQKKQSFPKEKDYKEFLRTSGFTEKDVLFRVRLDYLSNKLREKVVKGKDKVTDEQVRAYYEKNKKRFAQPERRDLRVVMTRTRAKAAEARAALESGRSWASVVKQYSVDELTKNQGGKLEGVARGQQERPVDKAIFGATKGDLIGPIKTEFGWYVIKVTKITKASQQSLEQASATIKAILASENQQKALEAFIKDFQEQWKEKTTCREGYVIQDCKNAPKPKTTATTGARTEGDQD